MISFKKPGNYIRVYWKETLMSCFYASNVPLLYRVWAVLHGFNPENAWFKGINYSNKANYLKDYTYYKNTPYNNPKYRYMVSKGRFRDTLKDFPENLPKYYAVIKNNSIEPKDAWRYPYECNGAAVISLLEEEKALAFKRIRGRAGIGFIVGRYQKNDRFTFNDVPYNCQEAEKYISSLDGYIVSEFVQQCSLYEKIWSKTTHTLRIQTSNVMKGKAEAVFAFLRFGSSKALYFVSHVISPGIYTAYIDVKTGEVKTVITADEKGKAVHVTEHPDTGVNMLCPVPHWDLIVSKCIEMHDKKLSNLSWLGWDIVITDDGFRILEINTLSGVVGVEAFDPILGSEKLKPHFRKLIYEKKKYD